MHVVLVGPDRGLGTALADRGVEVARVDGVASGDALDAAGVAEADLLVVTDVGEATAVAVAREANPDLRVVVYAPDALPPFASRQVDLAVSPAVLDPDVVAEELTGSG